MENWVLQIAKRHRELGGVGYFYEEGILGQEAALWQAFTLACDIAVRTFSSCFGRALFVVRDPSGRYDRSRVVAEHNPDNVRLRIQFGGQAGLFEATTPDGKASTPLRLVLDDANDVWIEHSGRLISPEEAARIVLAPVFFGLKVHVPQLPEQCTERIQGVPTGEHGQAKSPPEGV